MKPERVGPDDLLHHIRISQYSCLCHIGLLRGHPVLTHLKSYLFTKMLCIRRQCWKIYCWLHQRVKLAKGLQLFKWQLSRPMLHLKTGLGCQRDVPLKLIDLKKNKAQRFLSSKAKIFLFITLARAFQNNIQSWSKD